MSYGKAFASMYTGSMVGSGAIVFAVWGYVVANMKPARFKDRGSEMIVELNTKILATVLGESVEDVESAIAKLCAPDPESRSTQDDGRRLIDEGAFLYRVVNGRKYAAVRDEQERKEQCRLAMQRHRAKKNKPKATPQPGEGLVNRGADPGEVADMVNRERAENRAPGPEGEQEMHGTQGFGHWCDKADCTQGCREPKAEEGAEI